MNKGNKNAPERLPYQENEFVKTVVRILDSKNNNSTFADRYRDGYGHLKNNSASLAASAYLSAFLQAKEVFLGENRGQL